MLRARAWKGRGHPFICTNCRLRLHLSSTCLLSQQRAWPARSLCTTSGLRNSNDGENKGPRSNFAGKFARGSNPPGSSWGSFASVKTSHDTSSSASDSLLPHEREARNRTAGSEAKTSPDRHHRPTPRSSADQLKTETPFRASHQAQVNKSKSVLSDVFRSIREPQSSSAAKSTPASSQSPPARGSTSRFAPGATNTSSSSQFLGGNAHSGQRKTQYYESTKQPPGGAPRQVGWGTFSNRKAQVPTDAQNFGIDSTIRSEITRSNRSDAHSQHKTKILSSGHTAAATSSATGGLSATQDFWGELDTRVADLKEGKGKGRREVSAADGLTKKSTDKNSGEGDAALHGRDTSAHHASRDGDRRSERWKSRFEIEEEETRADEKRPKKSKKSSRARRMEDENWDDESIHRWEHKQRRKVEKEARRQQHVGEEQPAVPIFLPEYISASNLAQALKQRPEQFLVDMEEMGFENVTPDTIMTGETAALISMEYGLEPSVDSGSQRDLRARPMPDDVSSLPSRPPVVTIMGHVDHGKTTLLDWLRKSSVAAQEHGGITQHIGAFVVKMSTGRQITFLDTPGHAAFLSMRQRGANVTDIVVLVVAADDSVMPQTIEALKHATSAKVPIIVAINKIDKEDARVDQVKADLARHGVEIEDYGGDVQVVCVSGKTGQGMADLEENIVALSEMLDFRAEPDGMAEGWVLESSVKQNGKAATVLVKRGTLCPGDVIVAGKTWARIRVLRNEAGKELAEAPPGSPVEILGWRELPDAGQRVLQAPDEGRAKTAVEYRMEMAEREESSAQLAEQEQRQRQREKAAADAAAEAITSADQAEREPAEQPGVLCQNFTVKADAVGSVEAVCGSILELGNHEVRPRILRSAAGQVSEYDIDHAAASNSVIVSFNLPVLPHIKQRAEDAKVKILDHNVIYHVVDDVKAALSALLPMNVSSRVSGEADILQIFPINVKKRVLKNIAGCRVRNGSIKKSSLVKVIRKGKVIFQGKIDTLKHVKKDVMEMGKGTECGIGLEDFQDFQVDDQIQTYEEVREERKLL